MENAVLVLNLSFIIKKLAESEVVTNILKKGAILVLIHSKVKEISVSFPSVKNTPQKIVMNVRTGINLYKENALKKIQNVSNMITLENVRAASTDALYSKMFVSLRINSVTNTVKMGDAINAKQDTIHLMMESAYLNNLDASIKKEYVNIAKILLSMMKKIKFVGLVDVWNFFLKAARDVEIHLS